MNADAEGCETTASATEVQQRAVFQLLHATAPGGAWLLEARLSVRDRHSVRGRPAKRRSLSRRASSRTTRARHVSLKYATCQGF